MRFVLKQASCGSERVGCLSGFLKSPNVSIETPTSALYTQGASVTHLTSDVLSEVFSNPQLLWVPLSSSIRLEAGVRVQGQGVAKFAGLPNHLTCVTLQSITDVTPLGHFELDKIPLWTMHGKKMMTADMYMNVMEAFKPDFIVAIADGRTNPNESFKRVYKSVQRTCNLLNVCMDRYKASKELQSSSLIAVIVGSSQDKQCDECIKHLLKYKEDLGGVVLSGITDGTEESLKVPIHCLEKIFKKVADALPKDLVRIIEGSWNPAVIVAAIEHGWDIFDGSYPLKLTDAGHALALNLDVHQHSDEVCILDLIDIRYKDDFRPILEGCECLACKKHTRAYIRHLLNTREMLSNVLLNIHNLHHFDQMFAAARRYIAENAFPVFKRHITEQYELYKSSQTNGSSVIDVNVIDQENGIKKDESRLKKKIKVSKNESADNTVVSGSVA